MSGQLNIFDAMTDSLEQEIQQLNQHVQTLEKQNADAEEEIVSSKRYLDNSDDWHDRKEYESDIRYCENKIRDNNKMIASYQAKIIALERQLRESKGFAQALKDKTNTNQK